MCSVYTSHLKKKNPTLGVYIKLVNTFPVYSGFGFDRFHCSNNMLLLGNSFKDAVFISK